MSNLSTEPTRMTPVELMKADLKPHSLSEIVSRHTKEEFEDIKENIRLSKLQVPVKIYEDQILDGNGRYQACVELVREGKGTFDPNFRTEPFIGTPEEARAYVISMNKRRHLTASKRAMSAARMVTTMLGGNRQSAKLLTEIKQETAAQLWSVSIRMVTDAKKILPDAELVTKVDKGELTVAAAAKAFDAKKAKPAATAAATTEPASEPAKLQVDTAAATKVSEKIDGLVDDLIEALDEYKELSGEETAVAAAAGVIKRLQDAKYVEKEKKKAA